MRLSKWMFATCYDVLNLAVEHRLTTYREQTAGCVWGDVLEIGGGAGANLPFYPRGARLTIAEPDPHMAGRLIRKAARLDRAVTIVPDMGEKLRFADRSFDSVVTTLVLCMVEDLHQVVREAHRILRPGGTFFFYEHVVSRHDGGRKWQNRLNPVWRFLTTGCNLNRDIAGAIQSAGFKQVEFKAFDLSVGLPVTVPNIVGAARV